MAALIGEYRLQSKYGATTKATGCATLGVEPPGWE